jgi:hypothetical protein
MIEHKVDEQQMLRLAGILKQLENWMNDIAPLTKDETVVNGVCPWCQKPFRRKKPYQVFCDTPCQKAFNNAKRSTKAARIAAESEGMNAVCVYCKSAYTIMPSDRGTAWAHYCQICRTSFQPWLDAHPDYQSGESAQDELKRLVQESDATPVLVEPLNKPQPPSGNQVA